MRRPPCAPAYPSCRLLPLQLSEIEDKLRELDAERAELMEYQDLDRRRRCLQYTLFDKELAKATADAARVRARAVGDC